MSNTLAKKRAWLKRALQQNSHPQIIQTAKREAIQEFERETGEYLGYATAIQVLETIKTYQDAKRA